jgi:Fe-Mn family superoxide dismutase
MKTNHSYLVLLIASILLIGRSDLVKAQNSEINSSKNNKTMTFEKVALPYATDALEPVISKQTIEFHYGKHLQAYVDNLNKLIVGTKFENSDLETIVKESDGAIFNNAGQTLNHNLYFTSFSPNGGGEPKGKLAEAINAQFGSFEKFKEEFTAAGVALFGSGWVWLAKDADGKLSINSESNAGNPIRKGLTPILGFDVWEHSYYLDYQNRRADHLKELWKIIDWDVVSQRY